MCAPPLLRFPFATRSLNLAIHALRLRSQKMLRSQSRERLLFNRCSLLLFSCPTMLDTGAVGPTLYVFIPRRLCIYIEVLCTLVILAVVETRD